MKILVVEDNYASRKLLKNYLEGFGECDFATDGAAAVALCAKAAEEGTPYPLVLLDILLPELDGHAVLTSIRKGEAERGGERKTRVVMVTSNEDRDNIVRSFDEGADGYVVKPVDAEKLDNVLGRLGFERK